MAFSKLTLTFNEDIPLASTVAISIEGATSNTWTWVTTRSVALEVTKGTPTATPGESDALTFKTAFDLDMNGTGDFTTSVVSNVLTIEATNSSIRIFKFLTTADIDGVIDNPTVLRDRINVRSPYFLYAPIYDGASLIIPEFAFYEIYIWSGDVSTDKPLTPTYPLKVFPRFLGDQIISTDVSKIISDYIDNTYSGLQVAQSVFVQANITTTHSAGTIVENDIAMLAYDGFNTHLEGVNYLPDNDLMINNRFITVPAGEDINLPFYLGGDDYTIESRNNTTVLSADTVTPIFITDTNTTVENIVISSAGVNNIRVVNNTLATEFVIDVEEVNECIYDPIKITFVNSDGIKQDLWSYKVNKEVLTVKDENFTANMLEESIVDNKAVLSYSTSKHNTKTFNKTAKKSITLNTGYMPEDNNILMEELMESEYVWLTINSVIIPVNLTSKSLSLLTKRNDQLIKYALKFDYSYSEIQNIR